MSAAPTPITPEAAAAFNTANAAFREGRFEVARDAAAQAVRLALRWPSIPQVSTRTWNAAIWGRLGCHSAPIPKRPQRHQSRASVGSVSLLDVRLRDPVQEGGGGRGPIRRIG